MGGTGGVTCPSRRSQNASKLSPVVGEGGNHGVLGAVGITVWIVERGPYVLEANAGENIGAISDGEHASEVRARLHGLRLDSSESRL